MFVLARHPTGEMGTHRDIAEHRAPRGEKVLLEHVPRVAGLTGYVDTTQFNPPSGGLFETGNHIEKRGLSAARRTNNGDKRTLGNVERRWAQRLGEVEGFGHAIEV